ncbi:TM2 domain-containing protein [Siccationidurans ginsengisoli]|nr:TM2 domain-containing protein [Hymenobacter sp. BT559]
MQAPVAGKSASEEVTTAAPAAAAQQVATAAPVRHSARRAAHQASASTAAKEVTSTPAAVEKEVVAKLDRKALKKELKRQLAAAPQGTTADGKSQLTALLLNIFLGALGVHRFYLGYVGRGILYIALFLTSFLILPGIALFVLEIIDLIRIITGKLKPKNGEYGKTFNN